MTSLQAIILGVIQGLTEFLPVSSSGHLVLFQHLFGLNEPELLFNIAVHLGTLAAVCLYFRKDIAEMVFALTKWLYASSGPSRRQNAPMPLEVRLALMIIVGSIPTAIIGIAFRNLAHILFSSVLLVGGMLVGTGFWMWFTRYNRQNKRDASGISLIRALLIGTAQGLAVIPGISRSGATIAAGIYLGLNRETAARYSFLLSIPAIVGAAAVSLSSGSFGGNAPLQSILLGGATAALIGYGALSFLVYLVKKGHLHFFSPYCWLAGIIALAAAW